jgi:hypothetical protein
MAMKQMATRAYDYQRAERRRAIGRIVVGLGQAVAVVLCGWLFLLLLYSLGAP